MQTTRILVLLTIFAFTSCVTDKSVFQKQRFADFGTLKLSTAIVLEKKESSKDITPKHLIGIGEGIYPNKNKYVLATPKIYRIKEMPNFELEIDYFYSLNDSSVKVILYQWDNLAKEKSELLNEENATKKFKAFHKKFDSLRKKLTQKLGQPIEINIEQNKTYDRTFRDDLKWKSKTGLNAYLFMFGNKSGYRQIRLAIYKD